MATIQSPPPLSLELDEPDDFAGAGSRGWRQLRSALWLVVSLAILSAGAYAVFFYSGGLSPADSGSEALLRTVERSDLLVTVTEDGAVESASNVDIKCEVAGGSTILWIVPDGTQVKDGDELVRLDSSVFEEQVSQQQILYEKAMATKVDSEKLYSAAKIAVREYIEGTYLHLLQTSESAIIVALENLRTAENALDHAQRMVRKGYVTALQRDAQAFAVQRAKLDLETAKIAKNVLEKFTRAKMLEELEAKRDSAEAKMRSDEAAFALEEQRLKRFKLAVEKCVIHAPRDGMVIYANETRSFSGSTSVQIEEGAAVRERQSIIKLPDLSRMQVKATVHESRVDDIRVGMRARVRVQGHEFRGAVKSVANQAEPSSFMSSNVKKYATTISIEDEAEEVKVKPGMTAVVEILIEDRPNVLSVPVEAVVEQGDKFYCWIMKSGQFERRPLVLGANNRKFIEVKDGLSEGDKVVLNPRARVPEAREETQSGKQKIDIVKSFGEAKPVKPGENAEPASNGARPTGGGRSLEFSNFDTNGDKKITREEAPERMQQGFDFIDTDHDGSISVSEFAALRKRVQQQAGGASPPGAPPGNPSPANGSPAGGQ